MNGNISYSHLLVLIAVLLISMSIHEAMHAFVGLKLGDTTASDQGRVSLNPLRHIDPFMTVLLPAITIFLFGFPVLAARPVPFNPDRVKFDEFGAALIAAAGPFYFAEDYHQQYLAKNPRGYCGLQGTGVACQIG